MTILLLLIISAIFIANIHLKLSKFLLKYKTISEILYSLTKIANEKYDRAMTQTYE